MNYLIVVLSMFLCLLSGQVYAASFTGKLVKVLDGELAERARQGGSSSYKPGSVRIMHF
jgi:hypothetical protein